MKLCLHAATETNRCWVTAKKKSKFTATSVMHILQYINDGNDGYIYIYKS